MWKNTLAIIAFGGLVTGSCFATPLHVKQMFMKDHMMKSSLASQKKNQHSEFKFSGTWAGTCNYYGEGTRESKIRIEEDDTEFSIIDLINEGGNDTYSFNAVKSEGTADKDWYDSFNSRLTRINETTLKLEGTGVFANQLPSSNKEKGLNSGVFTGMYTVNNNQLIIDIYGKIFHDNQNDTFGEKCILKKVG
jgi:hypothetical protein